MFGIGFGELLVILVVILVFVRPEDLPGLARKTGAIIGKLGSAYENFIRGTGITGRTDLKEGESADGIRDDIPPSIPENPGNRKNRKK